MQGSFPPSYRQNAQLFDGKNGFVTSFLKRKNEQGQGQIGIIEVDWQYTLFHVLALVHGGTFVDDAHL